MMLAKIQVCILPKVILVCFVAMRSNSARRRTPVVEEMMLREVQREANCDKQWFGFWLEGRVIVRSSERLAIKAHVESLRFVKPESCRSRDLCFA